jgi:PAS domain S-box-containing protein
MVLAVANLAYWFLATARGKLGAIPPMAPVVAFAYLLLALGFVAVISRRESPGTRRLVVLLSAAAGVIATAAAVPGAAGGLPDWEAIFDPVQLTFFGTPIGGTTLTDSLLILVTAFNLCAVLLSSTASRWWKIGALVATACALLGFFHLVSDTAGNPVFSGGGLFGVGPLPAVEFSLLNLGLALSRDFERTLGNWILGPEAAETAWISRFTLQLLGALALVALVGVAYLRVQTSEQRRLVAEQLKSIVGLKADQVLKWRQERQGDAASVWNAPWFREMASTLASAGLSAQNHAELESVTADYVEAYGYRRVSIFNAERRPLLSTPDEPDLTLLPLEQALRADFAGRFVEMPVHLDRRGTLLSGHLVRIRKRHDEATGAYVLLQEDLAAAVFPTLWAWPQDKITGQSVLWLRKDNELYALGGYRDTPGVPAESRRPFAQVRALDDPANPMTRVANGETEVLEGLSFRGLPLLRVGRLIPNSDWMITSSIESREAYAPLRRTSWMVVGFSSLVLGSVGFVTIRFWREQQKVLVHQRLLADLERRRMAARLGMVLQDAVDIILVLDEGLRIEEVNQQAVRTYGWSRAELRGRSVRELLAEQPPNAAPAAETDGRVYETMHRRKDGTALPVEVSLRRVEIDGRAQWLSVVRDISERKRAEMALRESERQLHSLINRLHTVREDEAKRIARELHDDLGQKLTVLNMELADLERKLPQATVVQLKQIERMRGEIDHIVGTVQKISGDLRLGQLDILGLTAAIEWHLQEFARQAGISCRIAVLDEAHNLSDVQRTTIFRILQEALTNVARHAGATEVVVSLEVSGDDLALTVNDDGRGITAAQLGDRNSIGLLGMRERALLVGGEAAILPRKGGGTTVLVRIPLQGAAISYR